MTVCEILSFPPQRGQENSHSLGKFLLRCTCFYEKGSESYMYS
uniref:Uncharacterized protein n=1 Tax=Anguilla anguilla TaxID=7936 RepID=A0A0E9WJJ2_ANGAN